MPGPLTATITLDRDDLKTVTEAITSARYAALRRLKDPGKTPGVREAVQRKVDRLDVLQRYLAYQTNGLVPEPQVPKWA